MDGQGIAHPRGLGLASHLGLVLEVPTMGMAKSRLVGEGPEPAWQAGSASELIWQGKVVGLILRTVSGRKPLYLSPGHLITLPECREIGLGCVTGSTGFPCPCERGQPFDPAPEGRGP